MHGLTFLIYNYIVSFQVKLTSSFSKKTSKETSRDISWKWTEFGILVLSSYQKRAGGFRKGIADLEDDPSSGGPAIVTTEEDIDQFLHLLMTINQIINGITISCERVEDIYFKI